MQVKDAQLAVLVWQSAQVFHCPRCDPEYIGKYESCIVKLAGFHPGTVVWQLAQAVDILADEWLGLVVWL
jgi:hypothetical protein